jgi:HSP20 family protein
MRAFENELATWARIWDDPDLPDFFASRGRAMAVDFSENDSGFTVKADLPGVRKEDVEITLKERVLTIKGSKKSETEEGKGTRYFRRETWAGSFERSVVLPETADDSTVKAEMKDGVLTVSLKKREEAKPRTIDING